MNKKAIIQLILLNLLCVFVTLTAQDLQDWGEYEDIKNEAVERIEEHRKGDAQIEVILPNATAADNIELRVKLKRHDFLWGTVVKPSFVTSPYADLYQETFLKYFNAAGFNVALKPKQRGNYFEQVAESMSMPWFLENDIYMRGHTLAWEGANFLRPEDRAILEDPNLSNQEKGDSLLVKAGFHFAHAIPKWDVSCWDVSNEPIANNVINDLLPEINTHVYWFKLADSIRREHGKEDVLLYQNDYQIISAITSWALNFRKSGYRSTGRPALYREILDEQIALGAPIEGIGFQSRLKGGLIRPDTIYKRLLDFDRFGLPYQATEFEIRDDASKYIYTDEERRLLTEYIMVMYFSHPKVTGFWHWTFADSESNIDLDFPLFNYDGTPKVNGQKWIELMEGFFNIDKTLTTDSSGELDIKGYYGSYEINAIVDGEKLVGSFEIKKDRDNSNIVVKLEPGDFVSSLNNKIKKQNIQINHLPSLSYVAIKINVRDANSQALEIDFFSTHGNLLYTERLQNFETIIPTDKINHKGFVVAVVKDKRIGKILAVKKIIIH